MKTKQQIKEEYAASLGYGNWLTAIKCLALFDATDDSVKAIDKFIDGYQELCCNEVAKASLENAADNVKLGISEFRTKEGVTGCHETEIENLFIINDGCNVVAKKSSITSPDNIVKL